MTTESNRPAHSKYFHFENAPLPIAIVFGKNLVLEFVNQHALPLLKLPFDEAMGKRISEVFEELINEDAARLIYQSCFVNEQPHILRERQLNYLRSEKLHVTWFDITSSPLVDNHGQVSGVILYFSDITDRAAAKKSINQREEYTELSEHNDRLTQRNSELNKAQSVLQQLIDSSIEYITVIDRDQKFLAVNSAFEKFLNKSRDQLLGKGIHEAYAGSRGARSVELVEKVLAGERIHLPMFQSISRPGVWLDTHYVPLIIADRVEGVIWLARDITDSVRSQQELANVNRQLQEAQALAKLGSWEWDITNGTVIWSDEMYRIYGYAEKFPMDFVRATERMSKEDADKSSKRTQDHIFSRRRIIFEKPEKLFLKSHQPSFQ